MNKIRSEKSEKSIKSIVNSFVKISGFQMLTSILRLQDEALPTTLIVLVHAVFVQVFHVIILYVILSNHEKMYCIPMPKQLPLGHYKESWKSPN